MRKLITLLFFAVLGSSVLGQCIDPGEITFDNIPKKKGDSIKIVSVVTPDWCDGNQKDSVEYAWYVRDRPNKAYEVINQDTEEITLTLPNSGFLQVLRWCKLYHADGWTKIFYTDYIRTGTCNWAHYYDDVQCYDPPFQIIVDEFDHDGKFQVNFASESLTEEVLIQVFNSYQLIDNRTFLNTESLLEEFDFSTHPPGLYALAIFIKHENGEVDVYGRALHILK